jgi:predicted metal-dependent hydrolase
VKIGAIEILTNFPVEVPQAEIEAQLADTIAWLQTQQAKDLILKLTTNFG